MKNCMKFFVAALLMCIAMSMLPSYAEAARTTIMFGIDPVIIKIGERLPVACALRRDGQPVNIDTKVKFSLDTQEFVKLTVLSDEVALMYLVDLVGVKRGICTLTATAEDAATGEVYKGSVKIYVDTTPGATPTPMSTPSPLALLPSLQWPTPADEYDIGVRHSNDLFPTIKAGESYQIQWYFVRRNADSAGNSLVIIDGRHTFWTTADHPLEHYYGDGRYLEDGGNRYNFLMNIQSTSDVIKIDNKGKVTALKPGKVWVISTFQDDRFGYMAFDVEITVVAASASDTPSTSEVKKIKLNKTSATMDMGKQGTLKATISPSSAKNAKIEWKSSNNNVATVDANGLVTAVNAGKVTISATVGKISAACTVTVKRPSPSKVTIITRPNYIYAGKLEVFTAKVEPEHASQSVTWSSSNESILIVDKKSGLAKGRKKGKANIIAQTANGKKATWKVEVLPSVDDVCRAFIFVGTNQLPTDNIPWNIGANTVARALQTQRHQGKRWVAKCVYQPTKQQVLNQLKIISASSSDGDATLLFFSAHGASNTDPRGDLVFHGEGISPQELSEALRSCKGKKILLFGNCYGGIFVDYFRNLNDRNYAVMSAVSADETVRMSFTGGDFENTFADSITRHPHLGSPVSDSNFDGSVSWIELRDYIQEYMIKKLSSRVNHFFGDTFTVQAWPETDDFIMFD